MCPAPRRVTDRGRGKRAPSLRKQGHHRPLNSGSSDLGTPHCPPLRTNAPPSGDVKAAPERLRERAHFLLLSLLRVLYSEPQAPPPRVEQRLYPLNPTPGGWDPRPLSWAWPHPRRRGEGGWPAQPRPGSLLPTSSRGQVDPAPSSAHPQDPGPAGSPLPRARGPGCRP